MARTSSILILCALLGACDGTVTTTRNLDAGQVDGAVAARDAGDASYLDGEVVDGWVAQDAGSPYPIREPMFMRIMNADQVGGTPMAQPPYAYAYGPSIVRDEAGGFHVFACTPGGPGGAWDYIREVHSSDGINWTAPEVRLLATPTPGGRDFSSCDPSVVKSGDYYYLFYSGADRISVSPEQYKTVIKVARATAIDGPYLKYTDRGTWEANPSDPANIIEPLGAPAGHYGAGQQTVVVRDGVFFMWYIDDTVAGAGPVFFLMSRDAVHWSPHVGATTDSGIVALDVKYDERSHAFVSIGVPTYMNIAAMILKYSYDGRRWLDLATIVHSDQFPHYARVEGGLSGDARGYLLGGPTIMGFAAPHDLADAELFAYWDLYGLTLQDLSRTLFSDTGTAPFIRYTNNINDHWATTGPVELGYYQENVQGSLYATQQPGTVPLYGCLSFNLFDRYVSLDAACEGGGALLGLEGFLYAQRPGSIEVTELYRCRSATSESYVSPDPGCEGPMFTLDRSLGFAVR